MDAIYVDHLTERAAAKEVGCQRHRRRVVVSSGGELGDVQQTTAPPIDSQIFFPYRFCRISLQIALREAKTRIPTITRGGLGIPPPIMYAKQRVNNTRKRQTVS
jgi:hypothetical protein